MTLQGYQFDKAKVTPESDAQLYSYLARSSDNKVISGMTATTTGLNVYVASGKALVQGRLVEVTQQHQLTAQANKTGYVCITIDLTQNNTSTGTPGTSNYAPVNNQLRLELVDVLNQQDLNNGGLIYTFPLYSYVSAGATVTLTKLYTRYSSFSGKTAQSGNLKVSWEREGRIVSVKVDYTTDSNASVSIPRTLTDLPISAQETHRFSILQANSVNPNFAHILMNEIGQITAYKPGSASGLPFSGSFTYIEKV